jgi:hypothetical protein
MAVAGAAPSNGRRARETEAETVATGVETKRPDPPKWHRTFELPLLGSSRRPSPKKKGRCTCTGHCPSWARTRTLLIQSPLAQADISDTLLGFGHFPSIGARIPAVVCPLGPGETTAKLRRIARRTEPNGAGRPDRPPSDWRRQSECGGVRCARRPGTAPGHEDAKGWCTSTRSDPRRYREPVPLGSHPPRR